VLPEFMLSNSRNVGSPSPWFLVLMQGRTSVSARHPRMTRPRSPLSSASTPDPGRQLPV